MTKTNYKKLGDNLGIQDNAERFWSDLNWDRFIRDEKHFSNTVRYILENPDKANLPKEHLVAYTYTGHRLTDSTKQELHPTQVKMVMTRHKDDPEEMYELLGTKEDRKRVGKTI